ncbi:MAG: glycosyltransferase family 9 protein [Campylobacterales bacterium]
MLDLNGKKILLVRNDNIGDAVLSTPVLEAIKEQFPTCFIGVLCAGYSKEAFVGNPHIDRLFVYEKAKHHNGLPAKLSAWAGHLKTMLAIRGEKFDYAVGLRSSFSRSNAALVRWSGAKTKVIRLPQKTKDMTPFDAFIDESPAGKHEVQNAFDCLKSFGVEDKNYRPYVNISPTLDESVLCRLKESDFESGKYVVFHISSRLPVNRWKIDKFLRLASLISVYSGLKVVVTAAPKSNEEKAAKELFAAKHIKYFETSSLAEFGALCRYSKCLVTLDGGAMHYGAVFAPSVVAIFGKTNVDTWKPYHPKSVVLTAESKVADDISPESIYAAVREMI